MAAGSPTALTANNAAQSYAVSNSRPGERTSGREQTSPRGTPDSYLLAGGGGLLRIVAGTVQVLEKKDFLEGCKFHRKF